MRTIIAANSAGQWTGQVPRHFLTIDGVRLLDRTVRQFAALGDVIVSGPDLRYKLPAAALYVPLDEPANLDADILLSTRSLWARDERTVLVLGDTWFTEAAVALIAADEARDWRFFGRFAGSRYSGTDYGELFAVSWWPDVADVGLAAMREINHRQREEGLWRGGLWEMYRLLEGIDPLVHAVGPRFVEIDDETDDFDFPDQFARWSRSHQAVRA